MVYCNDKPVLTVCENTVFVKKLAVIEDMMKNAECGFPYKGAKEHYILDIDEPDFCREIVQKVEEVTPLPKPKKKKQLRKPYENVRFFCDFYAIIEREEKYAKNIDCGR